MALVQSGLRSFVFFFPLMVSVHFFPSRKRKVAETKTNFQSSRSHCIIIFEVCWLWCSKTEKGRALLQIRNGMGEEKTVGKLCLVDLAGSERVAVTGAVGSTLLEAQHSNSSLRFNSDTKSFSCQINFICSALADVFSALTTPRTKGDAPRLVPYRNSKLTLLMQGSFGPFQNFFVIFSLVVVKTLWGATVRH